MTEPPVTAAVGSAERTLALVNAQVAEARAELIALSDRLAQVWAEFDDKRIADLREANEKLVVAALRAEYAAEITARNLAELSRASQRDALTDTPNRELMRERLDSAIKMAGRSKTRLAALFVDLDQFKTINDTLGHAIGDQVMQIVARRLEQSVRQTDTVSRYGGDEFLVLLSPIAEPTDAAIIAAKINAALAQPVSLGGQTMRMSASIGIALYPEDGLDAETLINRSDSAMYRSKRQSLGRFAFYADRTEDSAEPAVPGPAERAAPAGDDTRRTVARRDLIDANERLVVAALDAQQAGGRSEESRLRQTRFMAMVAHELRDPLAPIRTAAELLVHTGSDQRVLVKAREIINRQVDHISRLVEDLIDSSRASTGKFHLRIAPVELVELLKLAVDACRLQFRAQAQTLIMALPGDPLRMTGDAMRLLQIFVNLLENAAKYTPAKGTITLSASMSAETITVSVADNGIGIARDTLPHIFDLFVQEPGDRARRNGGLGIGLAVVRELVEAHGGTVVAKSGGVDQGSEFIVTLPAAGPGASAVVSDR